MIKPFANTGLIIRFILKRDRVRIPVWILSIAIFTIAIALMLPNLYTSSLEREIMAETMKNPAITVMLGPGYGLDNYTDGAMMAHFMLVFTALATGIMGILLTVRHTREDEEEGRIEMIRSLPVGALSPLTATIIMITIVNIVLTVIVGFGLYSLGFESMDLEGSFLYGASIGVIGIYFAALTGLFAQLSTNSRSTLGYSFTFLIAAYIVRGIGDIEYEILSLISPLGLILRTEVYVSNNWWPVFATLGQSILLFALSLYLNSIRDLGAGFIPARPGRKYASSLLSSPLGLSIRLQRTSIIAWTVGMYVLGVSYGSILGDLEGFLDTSGVLLKMLPESADYSITERFITMLMTILSILGSIPVLLYVLKLKSEEKKARTAHLLARAVSKNSLIGSYTLIGLVAAPITQLMSVLGLWSAAIFVMDNLVSMDILFKSALAHLPAMWIMVGLAVLLIGYLPNLTGLSWLYLGYSFFVVYMGEMLQLPDWMSNLSPFGHIPQIPMEEFSLVKMLVLIAITAILIVAGFVGYNTRDLEG